MNVPGPLRDERKWEQKTKRKTTHQNIFQELDSCSRLFDLFLFSIGCQWNSLGNNPDAIILKFYDTAYFFPYRPEFPRPFENLINLVNRETHFTHVNGITQDTLRRQFSSHLEIGSAKSRRCSSDRHIAWVLLMGSEVVVIIVKGRVVERRRVEKSSKLLPGRSCQRYTVCKCRFQISNISSDIRYSRSLLEQILIWRTKTRAEPQRKRYRRPFNLSSLSHYVLLRFNHFNSFSESDEEQKTSNPLSSLLIFDDEGGTRALIHTELRRKMMSKRTTWACCCQESVVAASERCKGALIVDSSIVEDEGRRQVGQTVRKKKQNGRRCLFFFFSLASQFLASLSL